MPSSHLKKNKELVDLTSKIVAVALLLTSFPSVTNSAGGGYALESTQMANQDLLQIIEDHNARLLGITEEENPAQFEAAAQARQEAAEAALEAFASGGPNGEPLFQQAPLEDDIAQVENDAARRFLEERFDERFRSPQSNVIRASLARGLQPAQYQMSQEVAAMHQSGRFSWDAVAEITRNPIANTYPGQYLAAREQLNQEQQDAVGVYIEEGRQSGVRPLQGESDFGKVGRPTIIPASVVQAITNNAVLEGGEMEAAAIRIGDRVRESFANMSNEAMNGSGPIANTGQQELATQGAALLNELGIDPSELGIDPNQLLSGALGDIGSEFGLGGIDLSNPQAAAQSIMNTVAGELGLGNIDISSPEAMAQSMFNAIGSELGIGPIDFSNPQAAAQSIFNAIGSEMGIGPIDISNPQAAMQSIMNAAIQEISNGSSADLNNPEEAREEILAVAEEIESEDTNFSTESIENLLGTAIAIETEYYELIQDAQNSNDTSLVAYVNDAADGELSIANQVLSNLVALNNLLLELEQIKDAANGNFSDEDIDQVTAIINQYASITGDLSSEADIRLLDDELNNF